MLESINALSVSTSNLKQKTSKCSWTGLVRRRAKLISAVTMVASLVSSTAKAEWTGASTGATLDATHTYTDTGNWNGGTIDNTFLSALTGNTSLYFASDYTTTSGMNFTYNSGFDLTLLGDGTDRTLSLGGDVLVNMSGGNLVSLGSSTAGSNVNVDLGAAARTFDVRSGKFLTVWNTISNGSLNVTGGGTVTLHGANTFAGGLVVKSGTVVGGGTSNNAAAFGAGSIQIGDSATGADATIMTSSTPFNQFPNSYTNAITVASGAGTRSIVSRSTVGGQTPIFSGNIALNNTLTVSATGAGGVRLNGIIDDAAGTNGLIIDSAGAGDVRLAGANTFDGGVVIKRGSVEQFSSATALGTGTVTLGDGTSANAATLYGTGTAFTATNPITVAAGGTGTYKLASGSTNAIGYSGAVALNNSLTLEARTTGALTLGGAITGGAGTPTLTNAGAGAGGVSTTGLISGTLNLVQNSSTSTLSVLSASGVPNTFTGAVNIKAGTVILDRAGTTDNNYSNQLGATANIVTMGDATLNADTTIQLGYRTNFTQPVTLQGTGLHRIIFAHNNSGQVHVLSGAITLNSNDLTLVSNNAAGGRITAGITGTGNVIVNNSNTSGNGIDFRTVAINNVGEVRNISTGTIGITQGAAGGFGANVTSLVQNSATSSFSLGQSNASFNGTFKVLAGKGILANTASLKSANEVFVASGAVLDVQLNNTIAGLSNVSGTGGAVVSNINAGRTLSLGGSGAYSFNGTIGNANDGTAGSNLGLTIATGSVGTHTLGGNNKYTGITTLNGGKVILGNGSALGFGGFAPVGAARGNTVVKTGTTIDLAGQTITEQLDMQGGILQNSVDGALINDGFAGAVISSTGNAGGSGISAAGLTATVTGGGGTGATVATSLGVTAASFSITGGTTIYSAAPTVTITGGSGAGATATATLSGGATGTVTGITITNAGTGFTAAPSIAFTGGSISTAGTNPTGTGNATSFTLTGLAVTNPGTGYTSAPTVTLTGTIGVAPAIGDRALANVIVSANTTLDNAGSLTLRNMQASTSLKTVTKINTGTLTLGGSLDNGAFVGFDVQAGTVIVNKSGTARAASSMIINGGTVQYGSNTVGLTSGVGQIGTLVINTGTLDLNGASGNNATVGAFSGTGGTVTNTSLTPATLTIGGNNAGGGSYAGVIQNGASSVALSKTGTGTIALTGANTYTGTTNINAGLLAINGSIASPVAVNSTGVLGGSGTINNAVTVNAGGVIAPGNSPGNLTIGGNLSMNATGAYNWEFDNGGAVGTPGVNSDLITMTGGSSTLTLGGTLNVSLLSSDYTTPFWDANQTFQIASVANASGTSGTMSISSAGSFGQGVFSLSTVSGNVFLNWQAIAGIGQWIGPASGSWNTNTNWTGSTVPNSNYNLEFGSLGGGGTVNLDTAHNLDNGISLSLTNGSGGAYNLSTGSGGSLNLTGAISITTPTSGETHTISAPITGPGSYTKTGAGTLVVSGSNSYAGSTTVDAGTLQLGSSGSLGTSPSVVINTGATLDLNGNSPTLNSLSGAGGTVTSAAAATLTLNQSSTTTYAGAITGAVGLANTGSGTITLSGANTYTGNTTLNAGTVVIPNNQYSPFGTGTVTLNGSSATTPLITALPGSGGYSTTNASRIANNIVVAPGSVNVIDNSANGFGNLWIGGSITGSGKIIFQDTNPAASNFTASGALLFIGDKLGSFTGTIELGTVANSFARSWAFVAMSDDGSSPVSQWDASQASFILGNNPTGGAGIIKWNQSANGGTVKLGSLEGQSPLSQLQAGNSVATTFEIGALNTSKTFAGQIINGTSGGAASLRKVGSGTLTLSGASTYSGSTNINAGTLKLTGTLGSSTAVTVADGAKLDVGAAQSVASLTLSSGTTGSTFATDISLLNNTAGLFNAASGLTFAGVLNVGGTVAAAAASYDIFDWTTAPTGTFGTITLPTAPVGYTWHSFSGSLFDYTTGKIQLETSGPVVVNSNWNVDANGTWSTSSNWSAGVPAASGDTANFGSVITAPRTVTVDSAKTVSTINFNNANKYTIAGTATLTIDATSAGAINVTSGSHEISAPLALAQDTTVTVTNSSDSLKASNLQTTAKALTKAGAGTLEVNALNVGAATVNAGKLKISEVTLPASTASVVNSLSIAASAQLDITNNAMIVRSSDTTSAARNVLWQKIIDGQNGVDGNGFTNWDGPGIISSSARTNNIGLSINLYAVGIIANHDLDTFYQYNATNGGWLNGAITNIGVDDLLIRYTYNGDSNLDGSITIADYVAIDSTYGGTATNLGWVSGDFNNDGSIGIEDYVAIDTAYAFQSGSLSQSLLNQRLVQFGPAYVAELQSIVSSLSAVPEPTTLGLGAIGAMGLLARRRRRA